MKEIPSQAETRATREDNEGKWVTVYFPALKVPEEFLGSLQ